MNTKPQPTTVHTVAQAIVAALVPDAPVDQVAELARQDMYLRAATAALTAGAGTAPLVEVLTVSDPDYGCDVAVFLNGTRLAGDQLTLQQVDPGVGYQLSAWREGTVDIAQRTGYSPAFRSEVVDARTRSEDSEYIEDDINDSDDEDEDDGEHQDGDGCAIYTSGYYVQTRLDGTETPTAVAVEDLEVGDEYRDPATDTTGTWWLVSDIAVTGDDVHVRTEA